MPISTSEKKRKTTLQITCFTDIGQKRCRSIHPWKEYQAYHVVSIAVTVQHYLFHQGYLVQTLK